MVQVYTKPRCVQCTATYRELDKHGIEYEIKELTEPENLAYAKSLGHLQAPVVVTPAGDHWSGFRPDKIGDLAA